jgi:hypothetical protein
MAHVEAALCLSPLPPPLDAALNSEAFFVDCHERFRAFDNDNSGKEQRALPVWPAFRLWWWWWWWWWWWGGGGGGSRTHIHRS